MLEIHAAEDADCLTAYAVAKDNLRNSRTAIADFVNPVELTRHAWRSVAELPGVRSIDIEVIYADTAERQRRFESRKPNRPGVRVPT